MIRAKFTSFATLLSRINASICIILFVFSSFAYAENQATIVTPVPGTILPNSGSTQQFNWDYQGAITEEWALYIGSTVGGYDYAVAGVADNATTTTVYNLPTDGSTIYVRLWYLVSGVWNSVDATYIAFSPTQTEITTPVPGSILSSTSHVFHFNTSIDGYDDWVLTAGSTEGGSDYDFRRKVPYPVNYSTTTLRNLPSDGSTIYVRFWYKEGRNWYRIDESYTAISTTLIMTSPVANSTLSESTQLFTWDYSGSSNVEAWSFQAGSSVGASNYFSSYFTDVTNVLATDLPVDGSTVYIRLWYKIGSSWLYLDTTYTASSTITGISSPISGTTLSGASQLFTWIYPVNNVEQWTFSSPGIEEGAVSGVGSSVTSMLVTDLPVDGSSINVQIWYLANGAWSSLDATYVAASEPDFLTPLNDVALSGSSEEFTWTARDKNVTEWLLKVGTTPGDDSIYSYQGTDLATTVTGLPQNGSIVYAQLWYKVGGTWGSKDRSYNTTATPLITSPLSGSTFSGDTALFEWSANGAEALTWWIQVGAAPEDYNIFSYYGNDTSTNVINLPTDGSTIHVRLWYETSDVWQPWKYIDYAYTAASN